MSQRALGRAGAWAGLLVLVATAPSCATLDSGAEADDAQTSEGALAADEHVSMLFVSDVHFGADAHADPAAIAAHADDPEEELDEREDARLANLTVVQKNHAFADAIEQLATPTWAAPLAKVHLSNAFDGLVVTGDVTDDGQSEQWRAFVDGYDARMKRLGIPVYETAGNHDYPSTNKRPEPGKPADFPVIARIAERTGAGRRGLVAENGGGAYAFVIDDVLFVNLGVKASDDADSFARHGDSYRSSNPFHSLRFLERVLAAHGRTKKHVVLSFHYPIVAGDERMTDAERASLYRVIRDYPVRAIVHGHRHRSDVYTWCGVPVFEVDTPRLMRPGRDSSMVALDIGKRWLTAQTIAVRKDSPISDVKIGLDPAACAPSKPSSRCWSYRKPIAAIRVAAGCDVGKVAALP